MPYQERRENLIELMDDNSIALVYAGRPTLSNEDEYLPFAVNSQFFYLTGLSRAGMALLLVRLGERKESLLFIEQPEELTERWTGVMPKKEEVQETAEIEKVCYLTDLKDTVSRILYGREVENAYFDVFRCDVDDMPSWNAWKAEEFRKLYPAVRIRDLHNLIEPLRLCKDMDEIADIRQAIAITAQALDTTARSLKPGMMEYQAQALFEYGCRMQGSKEQAFTTIAAAGKNACSMHYVDNCAELKDGDLMLFDLGARYHNYCADISRTYPVNGKFTPRQREIYELVLSANRAVAEKAAPGVSFADLEELTCSILGEGLVRLGLLEDPEEVRKYYMHSVSHSIGIDTHDIDLRKGPLQAGMVISDEPGLYIDEEGIGIRIEDDLLITEDGCEVLSAAIPKDPDEIEALMAAGL